jgi:hypothetical protein
VDLGCIAIICYWVVVGAIWLHDQISDQDSKSNPAVTRSGQEAIEDQKAPEEYCSGGKITKVLVTKQGEAYAVVCK